jgi:hypothetical protein
METLTPTAEQQEAGSLDCGYHMLAHMEHYLSNVAAAASNDSGRFLTEFNAKDVMLLRAYVKHAIYLGARSKQQESQSRLDTAKVSICMQCMLPLKL